MDPSQRFTRKSFDQHRIIPYSHIDKAFIDEPKAKNLVFSATHKDQIIATQSPAGIN
jgi:hypothetical protein